MLHNKSNKKILEELDSLVYGHETAKKSLISLVNRSKMRHLQKYGSLLPDDELIKTSKCLLIGGSGTGKTYLIQCLADIADFPLLIVDGSSFNPTGASGGIKPETLKKLIINKASEYLADKGECYFSLDGVIDQMVVFVDEFDKLSSHYEGSSGNWNLHIQTHFLSLFENNQELSGVSWVFAGAFSGMDKDIGTGDKRSIGFGPHDIVEDTAKVFDEDVIKYGMLPEIVGRLTSICRLDILNEEDYYSILTKTIIPRKMKELEFFGIYNSNLTEGYLREMCKSAKISSQGVRYLYRELEKYFLDAEFNYEDCRNIIPEEE